jgi:AraC-like DNA-binding protein
MRKRTPTEPIIFDEVFRRRPGLTEYLNYPTALARDLWEHVIVIGTSRCERGHNQTVGGLRTGYLLHYVVRGELQHTVDGKKFPVRTGQACLLDFGKPHHQLNPRPAPVLLWWILFDSRDMPRIFAELGAERDPVFGDLDRRRFKELFWQLWELTAKRPVAYEAKSHAVLNCLLAELFASRLQRTIAPSLIPRKSALSPKVRLAVSIFEQIYYENIGLKQLQAAIGMDMYHFARKFRQEVGISPIRYLNRVRIEQAKRLLATTDKSVAQIACLVGIPDQNYLARLFYRQAGVTPQRYRKQNRERPPGEMRSKV